jgi:hypothetical protein
MGTGSPKSEKSPFIAGSLMTSIRKEPAIKALAIPTAFRVRLFNLLVYQLAMFFAFALG